MDCQLIHVPQNSDEWDALRRCRITGSRIGDVMADPKTKRYTEYRKQLILEHHGMEFESLDKPWFEHGKALEPRAIAAYEWRYNVDVEHDLFLIHHEYDWLSASPDFMTRDYREGGEIKCRRNYHKYREIVGRIQKSSSKKPWIPPENRHQVQAAIWLTGLDSWWYINYYENEQTGARKLHRVLVPRDDKLIRKMEDRCVRLMKEVRAA